jgi:hypothetical protein
MVVRFKHNFEIRDHHYHTVEQSARNPKLSVLSMLAFGNAAETVETNKKDKEGIYDTVQDC